MIFFKVIDKLSPFLPNSGKIEMLLIYGGNYNQPERQQIYLLSDIQTKKVHYSTVSRLIKKIKGSLTSSVENVSKLSHGKSITGDDVSLLLTVTETPQISVTGISNITGIEGRSVRMIKKKCPQKPIFVHVLKYCDYNTRHDI